MTGRDRMVIIAICVLVVLGACWELVVSPERKQAATLGTQVGTASAQLATAEGQVDSARGAQAKYAAAYAAVVGLGKAVPASPEVPSLIYQIAQASNQKNVEFSSITTGGGGSPAAAPAATSAPAAFSPLPFTFVFNGSFEDLQHLFQQLDHFTVRTASGHLTVSGRLLTIQSVKLTPLTVATSSGQSPGKHPEMLGGTITATAYVLPPTQAGATTGAPAGATPASSAAPASSSAASSSATAPAVAKVTP